MDTPDITVWGGNGMGREGGGEMKSAYQASLKNAYTSFLESLQIVGGIIPDSLVLLASDIADKTSYNTVVSGVVRKTKTNSYQALA